MREKNNMGKYNKFIVAIVGGVVSGLNLYFGDGNPEWVGMLVAIVTALGVYQVPNKV
jgi:type IV secretory pathway VirB2 component (pilin)